MMEYKVVVFSEVHRQWAKQLLDAHWGGSQSVSRGRVYDASRLPGFVAELEGDYVGLVTYHQQGDSCELVTLNSLKEGLGIGSALVNHVREAARALGCRRLWLITTNDNTRALRFYQKYGFRLAALHRDALVESRRLKPTIPLIGMDGIPIRDEIELEIILAS